MPYSITHKGNRPKWSMDVPRKQIHLPGMTVMLECIRDLELNLDLEDQTPVQKNYVAVPKPLYPEVKAYIEDLLNHDCIRKSSSSCSSPVVCVRKKDKNLRLCIDYRTLNKETRPDRDTRDFR